MTTPHAADDGRVYLGPEASPAIDLLNEILDEIDAERAREATTEATAS